MKKKTNWELNQDKAEAMTEKFIAVLENLDCFDTWAAIMIKKIIEKKKGDNDECEDIIDTLEMEFGFRVLKIENLAQEIMFEDFEQSLQNNPCQLKLAV